MGVVRRSLRTAQPCGLASCPTVQCESFLQAGGRRCEPAPPFDNGGSLVANTTMSGPVKDPRAGMLLERYRQTFGGEVSPVPVESIAEDLLGLHVEYGHELEYSGILLPGERRIVVNDWQPREIGLRRRFTLAHELGHRVCHCLEGQRTNEVFCRPVDVSRAADRDLEREANVFAAELIMPEPLMRQEWAQEPSLMEMCWRFQVSESAMHWRLYNLRLVDDQPEVIC